MKRWIWLVPAVATATVLIIGYGPGSMPSTAATQDVLPIDFSKLIRGSVVMGAVEKSKCTIENSVPPDTVRIADVYNGLRMSAAIVPSGCDETPSRGGLDGRFEASLSGFEKRSASGGDIPPRPAADQPIKDNRGAFRGKWLIRNSSGEVTAEGIITLLLHVNTHYPPAILSNVEECFVPGQLEGLIEGTARLGDQKNCRLMASVAGRSLDESPNGVNILMSAEGLVLCPCDNHRKLKLKAPR